MRHIDDYDDQIKQQERIKIGYKFNFKSMYMLIGRIIEEKGEYDEHYPKDGLYRLWGCSMAVLFILFVFSHSLFMVATVPFMFFYGMVIFQVFKALKVFEYKRVPLAIATPIVLIVEAVAGYYLQQLIFFS